MKDYAINYKASYSWSTAPYSHLLLLQFLIIYFIIKHHARAVATSLSFLVMHFSNLPTRCRFLFSC